LSGVTYDVVGDESAESSSEACILEVAARSSLFERGEDLFFLENRPPKNGIGWKAKVVTSNVKHLEVCSAY
jgi:hypothetical protein